MTQVGETEVMGGNVRDIVNRLSRDLGTRGQFSIPQNQERRAPSASAPPSQHPLFVVTYAYTALQSDELSLTVGDTIELISEVEDGWSKGKSMTNGAVGMFPTNFVTAKPTIPTSTPPSTSSASTSSRPKVNEVVMRAEPKAIERTPSTIIAETKPTELFKPAPFVASAASASTETVQPEKMKEMARVKFVYKPQHEDELTLAELDILVTITNKNCGDAGWFEGELNGKKGLFPDNFVELVQVPAKTESGAKYSTVNSSRQINFLPAAHKPPPVNPPQPAVPPKPAKIATVDSPPATITSSSIPSAMPTMPTTSSTPQKNNFAALRDKMSANLKVVAPEQVSSVQLKPAEQRDRASSMETAAAGDSESGPTDQVTELQHITKNRARPPKNRPMSMVMNRNRSSDESPTGRLSSPTATPAANPMSTSMFVATAAKEVVIPANSPFKAVVPPSSASKPALRPIVNNSGESSSESVVIRKLASPETPKAEVPPPSEYVSRAEYDSLLERFRALESRVMALEKIRF